jgi:hypothetical protein
MKRTTTLMALASAACTCLPLAAFAQTTNLYLVRVQDLSVLSSNNDCVGSTDPNCVPAPSPFFVGNTPTALAFGRGNLFVGGILNGTAPSIQALGETPWDISIVRVGNILTTRNFTTIPGSRFNAPVTRGYSGLDYSPNAGTGGTGALVATYDGGAAGLAGSISIYNNVDAGAPAVQAALVLGDNWRGFAGPAWDYGQTGLGFAGISGRPAVATSQAGGNGARGLDPANLAGTLASPVYAPIQIFSGAGLDTIGNNTEWRDFDVDPRNGNMVSIANNGVRVGDRISDSTAQFKSYSPIQDGTFGTAFIQGQRVNIMHGYGDAAVGDLIAWNKRPSNGAGQPFTSVVKFNRYANGAVVTPNYLNPDGTTMTFGPGAGLVNADGIGLYDFHWDQDSGLLFVLDANSRKVYVFSNAQPGPCCVGADCFVLPASVCTLSYVGGTVSGAAGAACSPTLCLPAAACCFPNGTCQLLAAADCSTAGGAVIVATSCTPSPCSQPVTGRCCVGSRCVTGVADAAACTALIAGTGAGAVFSAGATDCNVLAPLNSTTPCCLADFTKSGGIAVNDIFDFLTAWFGNSPNADIDGGGLGVNDIFAFLNAWFAGGC